MTASEVKTLITFFPLIMGKMIPSNDEVWSYLCNLLKICHILMLREVPQSLVETLRQLVEIHHYKYQKLFSDNLKPKNHNLVHYASSLLTSGTPRHQWAMRGEGKHREAKQYTRANNNKVNLCKSLSIKAGYKFAYNVLNNDFIPSALDYSDSKITKRSLLPEHEFMLREYNVENSVEYVESVIKKGTVFQNGTIFYVFSNGCILLCELDYIIRIRAEELIFICHRIYSLTFNEHLQSFEVITSDEQRIIPNAGIVNAFAVNLHKVDGTTYFRHCNYVSLG